MKKLFIIAIILLSAINCFSQENIKTHLFLGKWLMAEVKDAEIFEEWNTNSAGDIAGTSYYVKNGKESVNEILSLESEEGNLNYCAIVFSQNDGNKICYRLKEYDDKENIFVFENLNHDFPKRIIYKFQDFDNLSVRTEDDNKGNDFKFTRVEGLINFYYLKGKILKKPFVNKIGKEVPGIYDYFFEVQGEKYFIRNFKNNESLQIEDYLEKELIFQVSFHEGLWDSDDNNHQSRVGKYVKIYLH